MKNKILAALLALIMVVSLLPVGVLAANVVYDYSGFKILPDTVRFEGKEMVIDIKSTVWQPHVPAGTIDVELYSGDNYLTKVTQKAAVNSAGWNIPVYVQFGEMLDTIGWSQDNLSLTDVQVPNNAKLYIEGKLIHEGELNVDSAKWAEYAVKEYTVSFNPNLPASATVYNKKAENMPDATQVKFGCHLYTELSKLSKPTLTGHKFTGWYYNDGTKSVWVGNDFVMPAKDITLMAGWSAEEYLVKFVDDDGTTQIHEPLTVKYGHDYELPTDVTKAGYTFSHWVLEGTDTRVANKGKAQQPKDIVLEAVWTPNTYTITLDLAGGDYAGETSWDVVYNTKYSIPNADEVTKTGYTLLGWKLSYNGECYYYADGNTLKNLTYTALDKVTFTALWKANVYDDGIILDATEGGKILVEDNPQKIYVDMTYGTTYTLPAAEKDGYTFKGWKLVTDSREVATLALRPEVDTVYPAGTEIIYDITSGMTFVAQWQANRYTVYFDADGGSYTGAKKMVVTFGQPYGKLPEPARTGCSFQYWVDENGKAVNEHELVKIPHDHVLTAVYHVNELGNTEVLPRLFGLYVDWNKDGGSIKGVHYSNRDLLIALNAKRTLYFEPAEGYEVSEVFVNGVSVGNPSSFTIMNARMDYSVKVEYAPKAVYTPVYAEDFTGETSNWQVGGQLENFAIADGALKMTSTGGDPIIMPVENFNLKADDIDVIRIRYKNATGNANVQVFFTSDANTGLSEAGSFKATAANVDGTEWNEIVIDTSVNELWTGTIGIVRLDLASAAGELVLDSISFETVSYAK